MESNQKLIENDIQNNSYGHKMKVRRETFGSGLCKMGLNKHSLAQGFENGMFLRPDIHSLATSLSTPC